MDRETGTYADYTKVRPINFEGKYFKCRGPLNTVPSPQGRPTCAGRRLADAGATSPPSTPTHHRRGQRYRGHEGLRDDVRARAAALGRNPDDIKVLFLCSPLLGETEEEARPSYERMSHLAAFIEHALASMSSITDIDFSKFELDKPLPAS